MSNCEHGNMTAHGNKCPWCKIKKLEAPLQFFNEPLHEQIRQLNHVVEPPIRDWDDASAQKIIEGIKRILLNENIPTTTFLYQSCPNRNTNKE